MPVHEIICPHCKQAFTIDEAGHADIVRQVRNDEFQAELHERLVAAEQEKATAVQLAEAKIAADLKDAATAKDAQIAELKAAIESADLTKTLAERPRMPRSRSSRRRSRLPTSRRALPLRRRPARRTKRSPN